MSGAWVLNTDGAARGNPGPAAAGGTLVDPEGRLVESFSVYLGRLTNNEAEYRALLLGLALAHRHRVRCLEVRLDSELVVRQLLGQYKLKAQHLKPFYDEARRELARVEQWSLRHVPREQNRAADELANRALDERAGAGGRMDGSRGEELSR